MNLNKQDLYIIKNLLRKNGYTEIYNKIKVHEPIIKKKSFKTLTNNEKKVIELLFSKKEEQKLLKLLQHVNPDTNIQNRENLPEMYFKDEILLKKSIINNMYNLTEMLLNNGAKVRKYSYIILNALSYIKDEKMIDLIFDQDIDINESGPYKQLPLHNALNNNNLYFVQKMIEKDFDVNKVGFLGTYALHEVVTVEGLQMIIDAGANIDSKNQHGDTPLIYHTRMSSCNKIENVEEIIVCLLKNHSNINIKNNAGYSFIDYFNNYSMPDKHFVKDFWFRRLPTYNRIKAMKLF